MSIRLVEDNSRVTGFTDVDRERAAATLSQALRDLFRIRNEGGAHSRLMYAQGLVDGYMRSIAELGLMSDTELLAMVGETRRGHDGPATAQLAGQPVVEDARASA